MKILYVTTISNTMSFFVEHVKMLYKEGHTVEIACAEGTKPLNPIYQELGCKVHNIPFSRSPFSKSNIKAYKILKHLVETEHYDIVHTHTPNASMIARLACRKVRKQGTRVFYTAHGFHFFKGAPLKNWLMYYPVEKICAHFTDVLITINKEDYSLAQKKMHAPKVCYVPGVGIDLEKIKSVQVDRKEMRESMGIPEDSILLVSVGELSERKNHQIVIKAIAQINNPKIHYVIAGQGRLLFQLVKLSESLHIEHQIHFLGYRKDVYQIYKASDVAILPSLQEGLPVALMEAMACDLPIVCSNIRGNVDLIENGKGACLCECFNVDDFAEGIKKIISSKVEERCLINQNKMQIFDVKNVCDIMMELYSLF